MRLFPEWKPTKEEDSLTYGYQNAEKDLQLALDDDCSFRADCDF
jgi:hypothetical protein